MLTHVLDTCYNNHQNKHIYKHQYYYVRHVHYGIMVSDCQK